MLGWRCRARRIDAAIAKPGDVVVLDLAIWPGLPPV